MADPYAVILSFNRETKEQLYTEFSGEDHDDPGHTAEAFIQNVIEPDFPRADGWIHLAWKNQEAADIMTAAMLGHLEQVKQAKQLLEGTGRRVV